MRAISFVVAVTLACGAHAEDVYKCTDVAGAVAFQDHPCAAGSTENVVHIVGTPPKAPAPDASAGDVPATPPPAPPPPAAAVPPQKKAPPPMWACTHPEDGSQYMSRDGAAPVRMVPAGVFGVPGKSLGDVYGGRSGVGVSAPGVRKIPVDASAQASVASDYVAVQDQCVPASPESVCEYLEQQSEKLRAKLKRAFKDEQAVLQPQLDEIEAQLDGC